MMHSVGLAEVIEIKDAIVTTIDEINIPVREAGAIGEVLVKEGDLVEKGDILVQVDDELLTIQRDAAVAEARVAQIDSQNDVEVRYAQKTGAVAKAELERSKAALEDYPKSISQTELDETRLVAERAVLSAEQAERDLESKRFKLKSSCQQVRLLEKRIEMTKVLAPMSGLVTVIYKKPGEWATTGEPTLKLMRLDKLRISAFVDGTRFDQTLRGAPATFTVKLPPGDRVATFSGRVSYVDPDISAIKDVRIRVDIDNPDLTLRKGAVGTLVIDVDADRTLDSDDLRSAESHDRMQRYYTGQRQSDSQFE